LGRCNGLMVALSQHLWGYILDITVTGYCLVLMETHTSINCNFWDTYNKIP
jgi:hypothetical protein